MQASVYNVSWSGREMGNVSAFPCYRGFVLEGKDDPTFLLAHICCPGSLGTGGVYHYVDDCLHNTSCYKKKFSTIIVTTK